LRAPLAVGLVTLLIVAGAAIPSTLTRGQSSARVSILYDLGDGEYFWYEATVQDPEAQNASWNATLVGARALGLELEWSWFACCGAFVGDIGNRNPPAGFVGLFVWNRTTRIWDSATLGISGLVLRDGDAIGWYTAAADSVDFNQPFRIPVPTPDHPYPAPMFRGNLKNQGMSSSTSPSTAGVLWDRNVGVREIVSTPAVAHGRVFFATFDGLFALDKETGATLWVNPAVKGFSSPAVFDGTILVGGSDGRLYRIDAITGAERWNVTLLAQTDFSGITSSPKASFDNVYVGTFNEFGGDGEVLSIWVSNGTVAWRHTTGSIHFSSPSVADGVLFVGVSGHYNITTQVSFDPPYGVLALDASTGSESWFFPTEGPVEASPLVAGPYVVVPSKDGFAYAVDRSSGQQAWRVQIGSSVSSPAVYEDTVFVASGSLGGPGAVMALDLTTGATRWTFSPNGPVQASITYADGRIFFSTNSPTGTIYALRAGTGEPVWTFQPRPADYILGSPVVADGTVYAPSDNGHIYAIRDSLPSESTILVVVLVLAMAGIAVAVAVALLWRRRHGSR